MGYVKSKIVCDRRVGQKFHQKLEEYKKSFFFLPRNVGRLHLKAGRAFYSVLHVMTYDQKNHHL